MTSKTDTRPNARRLARIRAEVLLEYTFTKRTHIHALTEEMESKRYDEDGTLRRCKLSTLEGAARAAARNLGRKVEGDYILPA